MFRAGRAWGQRAVVLAILSVAVLTAWRYREVITASLVGDRLRRVEPGEQRAAGQQAVPPEPESAAEPRVPVSIESRRQQLIGVRLAPVVRTRLVKTVHTVGVVRPDETRLVDVNLKLEGWIEELFVDYTGRFVRKGEPLFTIYSPELVTTQNDYLLALEAREQMAASLLPEAREQAERLVDSARTRLALWDLPQDQMEALDTRRQVARTLLFRAPVDGVVLEKRAVRGMRVTPGESLYRIADLSVVWLEADIYEQDVALVRVGQPAVVTVDAYPGERFTGRVSYLYPYVDEKTRTVRARIELPNPRGRLKPGMYGGVDVQVALGTALVVPTNALLDSGTEQIVFVAQGDGYFEPRPVKVGHRVADQVEILAGLREGEQVAAGAAFFLDSESQLRASVQAFAPPPSAPEAERMSLDVALRTEPDPPQPGATRLEVAVRTGDGKPVTDAQVTVTFFMPAMPTMNMPAMRSEARLPHAGGGVYRGTGQIPMAGRWDVTIEVSRGGRLVGAKHLTVMVR